MVYNYQKDIRNTSLSVLRIIVVCCVFAFCTVVSSAYGRVVPGRWNETSVRSNTSVE